VIHIPIQSKITKKTVRAYNNFSLSHRAKFPSPQTKQCMNALLSKEISSSINGFPFIHMIAVAVTQCTCLA